MNVMRGTFRLSILVGVVMGAVLSWKALRVADEAYRKDLEMWTTLRCARHLLDKDTKPIENEFGNIDIGKIGCANRQFWANKKEIQEAWAQAEPDRKQRDWMLDHGLKEAGLNAVLALVLTNLLGLVFLGVRRTYRWVAAGFGQ